MARSPLQKLILEQIFQKTPKEETLRILTSEWRTLCMKKPEYYCCWSLLSWYLQHLHTHLLFRPESSTPILECFESCNLGEVSVFPSSSSSSSWPTPICFILRFFSISNFSHSNWTMSPILRLLILPVLHHRWFPSVSEVLLPEIPSREVSVSLNAIYFLCIFVQPFLMTQDQKKGLSGHYFYHPSSCLPL